ncbi:hypothetical protein BGW42_007532 [Actinomortierella wolfii]|nr:hypothetical protein BGW42_007532 [Actinomortierella wolfii]
MQCKSKQEATETPGDFLSYKTCLHQEEHRPCSGLVAGNDAAPPLVELLPRNQPKHSKEASATDAISPARDYKCTTPIPVRKGSSTVGYSIPGRDFEEAPISNWNKSGYESEDDEIRTLFNDDQEHDGEYGSQSQGNLSQEISISSLQEILNAEVKEGSSIACSADSHLYFTVMTDNHHESPVHDDRDSSHHDHHGPSDTSSMPSEQRDSSHLIGQRQESSRFPDDRTESQSLLADAAPVHESKATVVAKSSMSTPKSKNDGFSDSHTFGPKDGAVSSQSLCHYLCPATNRSQCVATGATSASPSAKLGPDDEKITIKRTTWDMGNLPQQPFWSPTPPTDDCSFLVDYDHMEVQQHQQLQDTSSPRRVPEASSTSIATSRTSVFNTDTNNGSGNGCADPPLTKISLPLPSSTPYLASNQHLSQGGSSPVAPAHWNPLNHRIHQQEPGRSINLPLTQHRTGGGSGGSQHPPTEHYELPPTLSTAVNIHSSVANHHQGALSTTASHDGHLGLSHTRAQHVVANAHLMRAAAAATPLPNATQMEQMDDATSVSQKHGKPSTTLSHLKDSAAPNVHQGMATNSSRHLASPTGFGHSHSGCNVTGNPACIASVEASLRGYHSHIPLSTSSLPSISAVINYGPWSAPSTPSGFSHPTLYHRTSSDSTVPQAPIPHSLSTPLIPQGAESMNTSNGTSAHSYFTHRNCGDNRHMHTSAGGERNSGGSLQPHHTLAIQNPFFNMGRVDYEVYGHDHALPHDGRTEFYSPMVTASFPSVASSASQVHSDPPSSTPNAVVMTSPTGAASRLPLQSVDATAVYPRSRPRYMIDDGSYRDPEPKHCTNCRTMSTPSWRRCPEGRRLEKLHGRPRPTYLAKDGSIKIQRTVLPHDPCVRCSRRDSPQWFRGSNNEFICNACNELAKQQRALALGSVASSISAAISSSKKEVAVESKTNKSSSSSKRKRKSVVSTRSSASASTNSTDAQSTFSKLPSATSFTSPHAPPSTAMLVSPDLGTGPLGSNSTARPLAWPTNVHRGGGANGSGIYEQQYAYAPTSALVYPNSAALAAAAAYAYQSHLPYLASQVASVATMTPPSSTGPIESGSLFGWQSAASVLPSSSRIQDQLTEADSLSGTMHTQMRASMANFNGTSTTPSNLGMMHTHGHAASPSSTIGHEGTVASTSGIIHQDEGISPSAVVSDMAHDNQGAEGQLEDTPCSEPTPSNPSKSTSYLSTEAQKSTSCGSEDQPIVQVKSESADSREKVTHSKGKRKVPGEDEELPSSSTAGRSQHSSKKGRHNVESKATKSSSVAAVGAAQHTAAARSDRYSKTSSSARSAAAAVVSFEKQKISSKSRAEPIRARPGTKIDLSIKEDRDTLRDDDKLDDGRHRYRHRRHRLTPTTESNAGAPSADPAWASRSDNVRSNKSTSGSSASTHGRQSNSTSSGSGTSSDATSSSSNSSSSISGNSSDSSISSNSSVGGDDDEADEEDYGEEGDTGSQSVEYNADEKYDRLEEDHRPRTTSDNHRDRHRRSGKVFRVEYNHPGMVVLRTSKKVQGSRSASATGADEGSSIGTAGGSLWSTKPASTSK